VPPLLLLVLLVLPPLLAPLAVPLLLPLLDALLPELPPLEASEPLLPNPLLLVPTTPVPLLLVPTIPAPLLLEPVNALLLPRMLVSNDDDASSPAASGPVASIPRAQATTTMATPSTPDALLLMAIPPITSQGGGDDHLYRPERLAARPPEVKLSGGSANSARFIPSHRTRPGDRAHWIMQ
jgi:hypothetical protein